MSESIGAVKAHDDLVTPPHDEVIEEIKGVVKNATDCVGESCPSPDYVSAAKELASRNITVNAIAPGYIKTGMTAGLAEKSEEELISRIPLARAGSPEDVAGVAVFLASEEAAYITGQIIHVNGGLYI